MENLPKTPREMLFARVKNQCKNSAFENLKLKSNDLGLS